MALVTHTLSQDVKGMAAINIQLSNFNLSGSEIRTMVLLVDDQPMVAEAIRRKLAGLPDIDLHYCTDGLDAINQANNIKPSVILQDLVMPSIDGLALAVGTTSTVRRVSNCPRWIARSVAV